MVRAAAIAAFSVTLRKSGSRFTSMGGPLPVGSYRLPALYAPARGGKTEKGKGKKENGRPGAVLSSLCPLPFPLLLLPDFQEIVKLSNPRRPFRDLHGQLLPGSVGDRAGEAHDAVGGLDLDVEGDLAELLEQCGLDFPLQDRVGHFALDLAPPPCDGRLGS